MPDPRPGQVHPSVTLGKIVPSRRLQEGAGVIVHRSIGTPSLRNADPFLMLDHFNSTNPGDYIAGFPDHPHRGFVTLTYLLEGHMLHQDSLGNRGDLRKGGAQWMKAARGVIHSEMPQQTEGRMSGFQLWINLPAREKMSDPEYQELPPENIPGVEKDGMTVRVLAGPYANFEGPIRDRLTFLTFLDIRLDPGTSFRRLIGGTFPETAFLYPIHGTVLLGGTPLFPDSLALLHTGTPPVPSLLDVESGPEEARFLLVSGKPIGEPIAAYGPFVMNTREEIEQALDDYRTDRLVR